MIEDWNHKTIVISRTDAIGDVMLTLPVCSWLKRRWPASRIIFLGRSYTKAILENHAAIDVVWLWDEISEMQESQQVELFKSANVAAIVHVFPNKAVAKLAKRAKVPFRIGTSHRIFHLFTCNVRPHFTRKKSDLHEAQLNFELLRFFEATVPTMDQLQEYTADFCSSDNYKPVSLPFEPQKPYVILHPKSRGSGREWPVESYAQLAEDLVGRGFHIYFTGTETDGEQFRNSIPFSGSVTDTSGKLTMEQLIALIKNSDGLVACSTGPMHISGFLNRATVGVFSSRRPIHPGRWMPLGKYSVALVENENCEACSKGINCDCIERIPPSRVREEVIRLSEDLRNHSNV